MLKSLLSAYSLYPTFFRRIARRAVKKKSNAIHPAVSNRVRTRAVQDGQQQPPEDESKGSVDLAVSFLGHDYYRILGISVNTPPAAIRRAYWQLQKKFHPDIAGEEVIESHSALMCWNGLTAGVL